MKNKISIIVSCYNTAKYVEKCLDSLLNQTYKNIEIILIDDASTDDTLKILKKYAKNNTCIKLFENKPNKGLAYSRNLGLKNATGEFIGFIDSDDYIAPNYYENLITTLLKENADLAICDIKLIYENGNEEVVKSCVGLKNKLNFVNNGLAASACNKLFKKELICQYSFEEGKINEDLAVVIPSIVSAQKIAYVENTFYNYLQREKSIQNSQFNEKRFEIFDGVNTTLSRISTAQNFYEYKDAIVFNQLIVMLIYILPKEKNIFKRSKFIKKFVKLSKPYEVRKNKFLINFFNSQNKKHQIYYKTLFMLSFNHCYLLASLAIALIELVKRNYKINIPDNITDEMLASLAKKQKRYKNPAKTISVIIPNYNYACFLRERLYSILYQNVKLKEIIILDDCSKDDSRQVIDGIIKKLSLYVDIKKCYNEKNSGTPFKQWLKGFTFASGDYVWIAEADDLCRANLLKELLKPCLKNEDIIISYSDTAFINKTKNIIIKTIKPEIDIQKTGHWNKSYVNNGLDEIKKYSFLNCTIANVSGCLIKNSDYKKYLEQSTKYHQAGDWLFYCNIICDGKIAYTNKQLNYYRVHGNNVSSKMDYQKHINEIKSIYSYLIERFNLTNNHQSKMEKRLKFLEQNWGINSIK